MSGRFFLSYSRRDQAIALRLADALRAADTPIWVDQTDIRPSDHWDRTVDAALRESAGVVLVLSPNSTASEHVLDEIAVAFNARKPVIPVLIAPCELPLRLARVHYIDATEDFDGAVVRCRAAIEAAQGGPPVEAPRAPAAMGLPASLPESLVGELARRLTPFLGPIAQVLAREEARGAATAGELIRRLADRIPSEAERARFLIGVRALDEG